MIAGMLVTALGIVAVCRLPVLPPAAPLIAALPLLLPLALCGGRRLRLAALFALGFAWGVLAGHRMLAHMLPAALEGRELVLRVCIEGLPAPRREARGEVWRLRARVLGRVPGTAESAPAWNGRRIDFSWYGPGAFRAGEAWDLRLRLRAPRGFANPGGLDHQAWLLSESIDATGYAVSGKGAVARFAGRCAAGADPWRAALRERLVARLGAEPELAKLLAVTLGDATRFTPADWELFARTGTTHLMVISGMHIALVAGLACAAASWLARALPWLLLRCPARRIGVILALPLMLGYAALAGWSVTVQRAALMSAAALCCLAAARAPPLWNGFAAALLAVLAAQPMAAQQAGFWLSFIAVAALLLALGGRTGRRSRLDDAWRPQWAVLVALAGPLALLGQVQAPLGPLVNAVAIPLVDVLVVPAALAGCLLLPLGDWLALPFLHLALAGLGALSWLLGQADTLGLPVPVLLEPVPSAVLLAALGAAWLLAPRGVRGRACGLLLLLPLLWPARLPPPLLDMLVLDVGQGTAVVLRTATHTLVYDAGPRFGERFDAGAGIVAPALRAAGVARVDRLVLSHADADHAGGAQGLLRMLPVDGILAGEPVPGVASTPCAGGQHWRWDGVDFRVLHPRAATPGEGNEASCVLAVDAAGHRLLLTGDIGERSERALLAADPAALAAAVLLVPHHGSRGSSSQAFVDAVRPRYAIVSAGYRNPFGHPHPVVVARYARAGAAVLDTPRQGALRLRVGTDGRLETPRGWRSLARRFWFRE